MCVFFFCRIGNARAVNSLQIRGARGVYIEGENTPETG